MSDPEPLPWFLQGALVPGDAVRGRLFPWLWRAPILAYDPNAAMRLIVGWGAWARSKSGAEVMALHTIGRMRRRT